jgi:hypothetical protein
MANKAQWTYMLRIMGRNPDRIPMERLGEYIQEFAKLLGSENNPTFKGIKKASTGLKAYIPAERVHYAHARIVKAKDTTSTSNQATRSLLRIEEMLGADAISKAQLLSAANDLIYDFHCPAPQIETTIRVNQQGSVDGVVVGIQGVDNTSHVRLLDPLGRILNLVIKDALLARNLATHFKGSQIRLNISGVWMRTDDGWIPESGKCHVDDFQSLENTSPKVIFDDLLKIPNNGWSVMSDPLKNWANLRGLV